MLHKYGGEFTNSQIDYEIKKMRNRIYFLLLIVDPKTKKEYQNMDIDVNQSFDAVLRKLSGLNELLMYKGELIEAMNDLEVALMEFNNPNFDYSIYRSYVLSAGNKMLKMKEV